MVIMKTKVCGEFIDGFYILEIWKAKDLRLCLLGLLTTAYNVIRRGRGFEIEIDYDY